MENVKHDSKAPQTIQSVERAFSILETLTRSGRAMSVSEIAERVNIQRTTTYALLNTLVVTGYVTKLPNESKFIISSKMFEISAPYPSRLPIVQYISSRLFSLGQNFKVSVRIAIPNQSGAFIPVMGSGPAQPLVFHFGPGEYPLHATSTGKLALSHKDDQTINVFLSSASLPSYTSTTNTDPTRLREEIAQIRTQGYSQDHGEYFPDMECISFPIVKEAQNIAAIVTFSDSIEYMQKILPDLIPAGLQLCRTLSMEISALPPFFA